MFLGRAIFFREKLDGRQNFVRKTGRATKNPELSPVFLYARGCTKKSDVRIYSDLRQEMGSFDAVDSEAHLYNLTNNFKPGESYLKHHILSTFNEEKKVNQKCKNIRWLEILCIILTTKILVLITLFCYEKFYASHHRQQLIATEIEKFIKMENDNQIDNDNDQSL